MAVNVVNPEPDPKIVRHVTCRRCGTHLSYLPVDIQKRDYRDYSGVSDTHYWIACPTCREQVTVGP
jgi:hypothetical protein